MTKATQPAHSNLGASSAYRWMECPASVRFLAENPQLKREGGFFADEGTAAHELAEKILKRTETASCGINFLKKEYVGQKFGPKKDIPVTAEMVDHVMVYVDEILKERSNTDYKEIYIESKVDLTFIHEGMFGTNDAIVVRPFQKITVYDLKYGAGVAVEVEDNSQMMYYALGAAHKFKFDFTEVEMVVVQPRCEHHEGPVRRVTISMAELLIFAEELKLAVAKTKEPKAEFASGKHCRFCDAKPVCPKLRNDNYAVARADFAAPEVVLPAPELLTNSELVKVLEASATISDWAKSVAEYAHEQAKKGKMIPGYKLVEKRGHRRWKYDDAVIEKKLVEGGGSFAHVEQFYALPKLLSPAQLEKLKIDKNLIASLTEVPNTGTNLVKDTNNKPGISVKPDFDAV